MDAQFQNLGYATNISSNAFKNLSSSIQVEVAGVGYGGGYGTDATLRLDSPGSSIHFLTTSKGVKRKWSLIDGPVSQQVRSALQLGLGNSSSSSDSKGSSATVCTTMSSAKETDEESSMDLELDFTLHLGNEKILSPKKSARLELQSKVDLELSLSTGPAESDITTVHLSSVVPQNVHHMSPTLGGPSYVDAGSASSYWRTEQAFHPLPTSPNKETNFFANHAVREVKPVSITPDLSASFITTAKSSVTCTSGISQQQQRSVTSAKTCQFKGCSKGARGASGLCIAHGGGRRCQRSGCPKGAEGRTAYCKAHGGGRRCEFLGCTKSAEGRTDFCIAHGGGRRCSREGCTRAARGKSGLCIRHGGGKRCQKENCTKSAEGLSGLCISHGGGRRCQHPKCSKGAQGSTMFCKAHGGGKRCTFEGCTKGAEGSTPFCKGHGGGKRCSFQGGGVCPKSVHGGTLFCVAHGGGKRCAVPECTKSARGRTDFCVRHGGGKRCKFEGCGKSAQGSTDLCKAHGGGKRCIWGQPGSEFGKNDGPCNAFARGKIGLCTSHSALVQDKRVHGGATLAAMVQESKPRELDKMKGVAMGVDIMKLDHSVVTSSDYAAVSGRGRFGLQQASPPVRGSAVPEGRVHGGSLLAMLAGNKGIVSSPSEPVKSHVMSSQKWI